MRRILPCLSILTFLLKSSSAFQMRGKNWITSTPVKSMCTSDRRSRIQLASGATVEPPPMFEHDKEKHDKSSTSHSAIANYKKRLNELLGINKSISAPETESPPLKNVRPSNIRVVHTLQEFKDVVASEKEKIVVVRWYASYCRSCKAIQPFFYRLAEKHREENVSFVEIPITEKNSILHQGLGIPSIPFGHIYHPDAGLVEELKISKKFFPKFERTLQWYIQGSCDVLDGCCASPFPKEEELTR
mmetsp:Transcript_19141/g.27227  ORF Transcript_19141/g.27227 Transcript_19141/m.27227 type:complete len:245 (-) Transcript_19141:83-817(-)